MTCILRGPNLTLIEFVPLSHNLLASLDHEAYNDIACKFYYAIIKTINLDFIKWTFLHDR